MVRPSKIPPLSVLFVGNSFTARNDLPGMLAGLVEAAGGRMEHRLISARGASLRMHWNKGEALAAIRSGGYGHVVLQEQSTLPVKNAQRMHENVRLFDSAIKSAGATTVLYMTWARRNQPSAQGAIASAYDSVGREAGALVVPAGAAWGRFISAHAEPVLHDKDQSHPTPAGSYLAACVFFATLLGRSPAGLPAEGPGLEGMSGEHARALQDAAWVVVRDRL